MTNWDACTGLEGKWSKDNVYYSPQSGRLQSIELTNLLISRIGWFDGLAVDAWGRALSYSLGHHVPTPPPPEQATNVIAVDLENGSYVALRADGSLTVWGREKGVMPALIEDAISLSLAGSNLVALRVDGSLLFWDCGVNRQLEIPACFSHLRAVELTKFLLVGLRESGEIWAWDWRTTKPPQRFAARAVKVRAAYGGFACVEEDGTIAVWNRFRAYLDPHAFRNVRHVVKRRDDGMVHIGTSNVVDIACCTDFGVAVLGDGQPVLNLEPIGRWAKSGTTTHFRIETGGAWPMTLQWRRNGSVIPGATNLLFSLRNLRAEDAGDYDVVVENRHGKVTSRKAVLKVD